jgi:hypothetical protein
MLYRQKFDTFIRKYDDIGYIINKADFSARTFDKVGGIFLNALSRKPKCLDCSDYDFCIMCILRHANENQEDNPLKINEHFCKVAALNRKVVRNWKENRGDQ